METMTDAELSAPTGYGAELDARHGGWWPWAALGFGAAIVVAGGILFTPSTEHPPRDAGHCRSSTCSAGPDQQ